MKPVIISTDRLSRSPDGLPNTEPTALAQGTCFADLPLPARLLLAVPRVRGYLPRATLVERYVLDSLGRIIDPGPERSRTIKSVNLLAEVLLNRCGIEQNSESVDKKWLSDVENLVLCTLCKIQNGQSDEATELIGHWLNKGSLNSFYSAASALCNTECFTRGDPHVFTPGCAAKLVVDSQTVHRSVSYTWELSLGELLLLNAIRLRMRTLPYAHITGQVVPMLRESLALPRIEALLDALIVESLQYGAEEPDVRCLCSQILSIGESRFLEAIASFATGDADLIASRLNSWLPMESTERLRARTGEFRLIIENLGTVIPRRAWKHEELSRLDQRQTCEHVTEPSMIH